MKIEISNDSWHFRLYNWWREFSGFRKPSWFKENLCHYLRVVLIWAPLGWFLHKRVWGNMRPWIVAVMLGMLFGTLKFFSVATPVSMTMYSVTLVLYVAMVWLFWFFYKHLSERWIFWLLLPVELPILLLSLVLIFFWKRVLAPMYFRRDKLVYVSWGATIGVISMLGGIRILVGILVFVGGLLLLSVVITLLTTLIIEGIPAMIRWIRSRRQRQHVITPARSSGVSMIDLLNFYRRVKWGSIVCPFIDLPE